MTNPLIPYSFTPGSKAKAQEVNANFLAVADGIDATKQYTIDEIDKINNDINDTLAKKDLSNTKSITNVILEAPDGIAEFSENSSILTIKKNLRVLIPDGRNNDGTFKSIDFKFEADKTFDFANSPDGTYHFGVKSDGTFVYREYKDIFESEQQPADLTQNITWHDLENNFWYNYTHVTKTWEKIEMTPILGNVTVEEGLITALETNKPFRLLDISRKQEIISWVTPDYSKAIRLAVDEPVKGYVVPQKGFIMLNALRPYSLSTGINIYINNVYVGFGFTNNNDISGVTSSYMVSTGDIFKISIKSYAESHMYFIPAKGEI